MKRARLARWFFVMAVLLSVVACDKQTDRLAEARRLLDEGSPAAAQQYIRQYKLDLTAQGAQMLVAAYVQNEDYGRALDAITAQPTRYTVTTRTDVCVMAVLEALGPEEGDAHALLDAGAIEQGDDARDPEQGDDAGKRLDRCEKLVDGRRVDFEAVSYVVRDDNRDRAARLRWRALADRIAEMDGGPEVETAASLLVDHAMRLVEASEEEEQGALLVEFIEHLDALSLRAALLRWQLHQIERLPEDEAAACFRSIERVSAGLVEEMPSTREPFERMKKMVGRRAPSPPRRTSGPADPLEALAAASRADAGSAASAEDLDATDESPQASAATVGDENADAVGPETNPSEEATPNVVTCPIALLDDSKGQPHEDAGPVHDAAPDERQ